MHGLGAEDRPPASCGTTALEVDRPSTTEDCPLVTSQTTTSKGRKIVQDGRQPAIPGWNGGLLHQWARQDLNLRPFDYESSALTTELRARTPFEI